MQRSFSSLDYHSFVVLKSPSLRSIKDKMESEIPADVKQEPEVYLDYPSQDISSSSESDPSLSMQKHTQIYGGLDLKFVKQELSEVYCDDRSHRFSEMGDMALGSSTQSMAELRDSQTTTENGYKTSVKHESFRQTSENMSSVIEVDEKLSLINENCQLQKVQTPVKPVQMAAKSCHHSFDYTSCGNRGIQKRDTANNVDLCVSPSRCDSYDASFDNENGLTYNRKYIGKKPYKFDDCDVSFSQNVDSERYKRIRTGNEPNRCDVCGASFTKKSHLETHKRTHTGEKPYKCDACGASFSHKGHMKTHKRTHTGEKPFKCDACGAAFSCNNSLKRHKSTHTGEKPYQCDACGASFSRKSFLESHKRTHTGEKPYQCDACGASFSRKGDMETHKRKHTGEKPYKCDVCAASFSCNSSLKRHMRSHTGVKPYKCDACYASFSQNCNMKAHKRKHIGEKPYKCDACGYCFSHKNHLKTHKRSNTGVVP